MTAYNFAHGGDVHYNVNNAMYPQNAFITGHPEYGSSTTMLKPADHWVGGHYAPVRHLSFGDTQHQIGLAEASAMLAIGDTFITHVIPSMSMFNGFHYVVHTPLTGATFTVQLASDGTVLGTIDASVQGDGWFTPATGIAIPSTGNDAIEFVVDAWPDTTPPSPDLDPCGVYTACDVIPKLCMTATAFYLHARAEQYCTDTCWDGCA